MFDLSKITYELNEHTHKHTHLYILYINSTILLFVSTLFCDFPKTTTCELLISTSSIIGPNIHSSVAM